MHTLSRYTRLWLALARYGLSRELSFRGNFIIKVIVECMWLAILLIFYHAVFTRTRMVASWSENEYYFYVGCYFSLLSVLETFFLPNCNGFADLVRTGDLDYYLLKPIDEQFLITCKNIEWSVVPSIFMGVAVMLFALGRMNWEVEPIRIVLFPIVFVCGVSIAYSFLLMFTASSVWLMRNQSLHEIWWLFTALMRYPRDIFTGWAYPLAFVFTFIIPVMIAINVPASSMVREVFDYRFVGFMLVSTVVLLFVSRWVFRAALKRYRSASS